MADARSGAAGRTAPPAAPADRYETWLRSADYRAERAARAEVIARLCREELGTARRIADLGAGTGLIKRALEEATGKPIVGFEIDGGFIVERRRMARADVLRLPVRDESLDLAFANHVYEHVGEPGLLFREIRRVLRPGGRAYVSAGNRLAMMEPHYRLPFLSWLPNRLAGSYLRLTGRGREYRGIRFLTYRPLRELIEQAGLAVDDRTERAVRELVDERGSALQRGAWRALAALPAGARRWLLRLASPQWFFVAERPGREGVGRARDEPAPTAGPRGRGLRGG